MTARYTAPRVRLANGQPAHTRRTERLRQPDKPSVRFIGDPVDEPHPWTGQWLGAVILAAKIVGVAGALFLLCVMVLGS